MKPLELHKEHLNEKVDDRYIKIKLNYLKSELDTMVEWVDLNDYDKLEEYLDDMIVTLKKLKNRL